MKVMDRKSATNLGSVIEINPASISRHYPYDEIEYIDISSVDTGFFSGSTRMPLAEAPSRAKRLVEHGDTILATVRPNLRSFLFIKNPPENMVVSTGFAVLHPSNKIDARFLYFTVTNQKFTDYLTANAKGSAYPAVDTETIARAEISFPTLEIQRKIAVILSAYDDLIENNLRRIKILEEMARSLYREWFVKFRFPGHQKVKMVNSPLGKIPEGWEVSTLGNESKNFDRMRKPLSKMEREKRPGPYPYYGAAKVFDHIDDFIFNGIYLLIAEDGSVVTPDRKPVLQYVNGKFWANNHTHVLQGKEPISTEFLHLVLSQVDISGYITGAAQPKITQENLNRIPVLVPSSDLLTNFNEIAQLIYRSIVLTEGKNKVLRQTRDFLLPKLISGELDVSELDIETVNDGL